MSTLEIELNKAAQSKGGSSFHGSQIRGEHNRPRGNSSEHEARERVGSAGAGAGAPRNASSDDAPVGDREGSIVIKPVEESTEERINRLIRCPHPNPDLEGSMGTEGFSFDQRIAKAEAREKRVAEALCRGQSFDAEGELVVPGADEEEEEADGSEEKGTAADSAAATEQKAESDEEGDAVPSDGPELDPFLEEAYPAALAEERQEKAKAHDFRPRSFDRAKLDMQNYQPYEKLTDFRMVENVNRGAIRLFWVTGLSKMQVSAAQRKQLGALLSSFPNIQVLGLQDAGIVRLEAFKLPHLLYADFTANRITDVGTVIDFASRSPFIQALNVVGNPFMRRAKWTDKLPSGKSQAWKIILNLPDLAVLNNEHISASVHVTAAARFGSPAQKQRAAGMGFDAAFCTRVPEFEAMTTWQPERITRLHLSGCGLTAIHILPFVNLSVLDVSKNELSSISSFGLEYAANLTAASFQGNPLPPKMDLTPLKFLVKLRLLFMDGSPLSASKHYRSRVISTTSGIFGSEKFGGLRSLDGEEITIEERLEAMAKVDKIKSRYLDQRRWDLALRSFLGKTVMGQPDFASRVRVLDIAGMGLKVVDLRPFANTLQVLRLPNNSIKKAGPRGLEECHQLQVLDLSGNPTSTTSVLSALASKPLEELRAVSIAPDTAKLTSKQWTKIFNGLVQHSPFLLAVEGRVPTMAERIAAYRANGLRNAALEKYRVDLATTVSVVDVSVRRYDPESVGLGVQYQPTDVTSLMRLHGLGIGDSALNLAVFTKLQQVNLANNTITDILRLGLESLTQVRLIDLSNNKIKNKPEAIGEFLNEIKSLQVISLRGNPALKRFAKSRLAVVGSMDRMREIECELRVIDTEVTVSERVQALKQAGVDKKEAESLRAKVALHMRTPHRVQPGYVRTLDLQGMELQTIDLSAFTELRVLRLNANKISVLHGIGLERMTKLIALDLRDNSLDLRKPQDNVGTLDPCRGLVYLGMGSTSMSAKERKTYRSRTIAALARLRSVKCPLRYLDDAEITAAEIVDTMKSESTDVREKFRFDLVRHRVLGTKDPKSFSELDLSSHGLGLIDLTDFPNLVKVDVSNNNLHTSALANSGLKDLEKLRELSVRGNPLSSAKHFGEVVNDLRHLRVLQCDDTPLCAFQNEADRVKLLGAIPRARRVGFKLKYLNEQGVSVSERCAGALVHGTDEKKVERLRLSLTLEEMDLNLKTVTSLDLCNRDIADVAVLGYNVTKHGYLMNLQILDLSNNRLRTLEKMRLGHLPALSTLNLCDNMLPDIPSIVLELEQCAALEVLYLRNSTESDVTAKPELYIEEVCSRLRSLRALDDLPNSAPFTEAEQRAANYLNSVCGMSLNGVSDIDLSNKGLSRDCFFFVLSALVQLRPVSVRLSGNKWSDTGVGPQNKFYRFYVIGAMEEYSTNRLETIDGVGITDDDKEAAINFLHNEEDEFGEVYPIYRILRGDWEDDRFMAKAKAESEEDRLRRIAKESAKFRKQKGPQIRDYQKDASRATTSGSQIKSSEASKAADSAGRAATVAAGAAASTILTVAPRATGSLLNKMEIIIGFFQIYGLVLAISFDFDIPYPKLWIDISEFYNWIPNLLSIDIDNIFVRLNVDLGEHQTTVKLLGSLLVYMFFVVVYFVGAGLDKHKWTKKYVEDWRRSSTIAFLVWFLSLFVAAGIAIGVDTESRESVTSLESPSRYAITLTAVIAGGFTLIYIIWQIVVRTFRYQYAKRRGGEFTKFWSRSKRGVQRLSLFFLTVAYMPIARMILTNFASEYDTSILDKTGCVYSDNEGRRCCAQAFPSYPCVQSPAATMLWLQYVSLAFAVIIVLGIPLFFVYLIRKGIEAVDLAGFQQADSRFRQKVKLLEAEIKNKKDAAKKAASEGEHIKATELRNERKSLKKTLKQTHDNWKNTFAYEVGKNPKAQTYLYQAYERNARYSKILQMFEKLLLVCIAIYVPARVLAEWKMFLSTCVVGTMALLSVVRTPFNDGFEDAMDIISRLTNSINVGISFGLSVDFIPAWIASVTLLSSNGLNLITAVFTIVISPIRSCLAQRSYRKQLDAQQVTAQAARKRAREAASAASSAGASAGAAAAAGASAGARAAGSAGSAIASGATTAAGETKEAAGAAASSAKAAGARAPSLAVAAGRATLTEAARFHEQSADDVAESLALAQGAVSGVAVDVGGAARSLAEDGADELDDEMREE